MNNRSTAEPIYRQEDNELMGYVQEQASFWECMTLFGYVFATAVNKQTAIEIVKEKGLSLLMDKWEYFDEESKLWHDCVIVEAAATQVTVARIDDLSSDISQTILISKNLDKNLRK